ncbi:MAG: helix-turn-helix transcriptional regulator [Erysipelothrix sp.]|nr:helix-turn-helix transcriptional regulator [Erysipelothrix sp.]
MKKGIQDHSQKKFGDNMRKRRLAMNISQEELSFRAGLHRNYISDVERGTRNVSLKAMQQIASGLETSLYKLLKDDENNGL